MRAAARSRSPSPPTGVLGIGRIYRHCRNEAIPVRHLNLRETLGVQDVALLDDAILVVQKCDQRVDFVRGERSRLAGRHGAVDIVPSDRRIRVVAYAVLVGVAEWAAMRVAGTTDHQTPDYTPFAILPVANRAPVGKDHRAF